MDCHSKNQTHVQSETKELFDYSVPQGSLLGPYFKNIYTNATQTVIERKAIIYVGDTTILIEGDSKQELIDKAVKLLHAIQNYFYSLNLILNLEKTVMLLFGSDSSEPLQFIIGKTKKTNLSLATTTTFLGIEINQSLSWKPHMETLIAKLNSSPFMLSQLIQSIDKRDLEQSYFAFFHFHISYGTILWLSNTPMLDYQRILKLQ